MWHRELTEVDIRALREDGDVVTFDYTDPFGQPATGFVVMWKGQPRAYRNLCPHWSVPIDHEGNFFEANGRELMCHVHGACFDPGTGECTWGPPMGSSLEGFGLEPVEDRPGWVKILRRPGLSLN